MEALALTDHHGLYGAVRFTREARRLGVRPILGAEIALEDGCHLVLLIEDSTGYSNLCRLLSAAHLKGREREPAISLTQLEELSAGLVCLSGCERGPLARPLREGRPGSATTAALRLCEIFGPERFFVEIFDHRLGDEHRRLRAGLIGLARSHGIPLVATNNVHYATPEKHRLQDLLVCVRTLSSVSQGHPERKRSAEYDLKSPAQMAELFRDCPDALRNTLRIAERCRFELEFGQFHFPRFPLPDGESADSLLRRLCLQGIPRRYPLPDPRVSRQLEHELDVIRRLGFQEYFLAVHDIVSFARSEGIRCSGRGSAAGSLVSYLLGITQVDPIAANLLFERLLNPERKGMPDVDIDFDSRRRDEVLHYVYRRFGQDQVAMVCTVNRFCARSAVREIGRALEMSETRLAQIARLLPHRLDPQVIRDAPRRYPELRQLKLGDERLQMLLDLCAQAADFPRHLGTHLGGVVIGDIPLAHRVPLQWAAKGVVVAQLDRDDIEAIGLVKMDLLGLRNLSAIEDAVRMVRERGVALDLERIPLDDPPTYELLRSTRTVAVFQLESPGMRNLLGRLQPTRFEDIVVNISLFRPGPMQADMVTPFLARRHGRESVVFLHPSLKEALGETYGVLIYQEQVLRVASAVAGFTHGQADQFRRAMTKDRSREEMARIREQFLAGAKANGVRELVAEKIFSQLAAFAAYGFCKAHAASFGILAYQTAYLKAHYPAEFLAGVLSNEPMGFYPAGVVLREAQRMGIRVLPIDINESEERYCVQGGCIRMGFMQLSSLSRTATLAILRERRRGRFASFEDFCRRAPIARPMVENLIDCGAFDSLGEPRDRLHWRLGGDDDLLDSARESTGTLTLPNLAALVGLSAEADAKRRKELPESEPSPNERNTGLRPGFGRQADQSNESRLLGLHLRDHPLQHHRESLERLGVVSSGELDRLRNGARVWVAGNVIVRHRPPTRSGVVVVFVTLEDEDGLVDVVVFPGTYTRYGEVLFSSSALAVKGQLQKQGARGISILAQEIRGLS